MSVVAVLTAMALVSATFCIGSDYLGNRRGFYLFKPLTMLIIIVLAFVVPDINGSYVATAYRSWIIAGLCCALIGDILLMLPTDRFLHGLVAFLLAHWCYIVALTGLSTEPNILLLLPWVAGGMALFVMLNPSTRPMRFAVLAYIFSILLMGWLAIENWRLSTGGGVVAAAAVLFMLSDTLIGFRRFRHPFSSAQALILGSYFPAQWLFAASPAFK